MKNTICIMETKTRTHYIIVNDDMEVLENKAHNLSHRIKPKAPVHTTLFGNKENIRLATKFFGIKRQEDIKLEILKKWNIDTCDYSSEAAKMILVILYFKEMGGTHAK